MLILNPCLVKFVWVFLAYRVTARGIERREIFDDDVYRKRFLSLLGRDGWGRRHSAFSRENKIFLYKLQKLPRLKGFLKAVGKGGLTEAHRDHREKFKDCFF